MASIDTAVTDLKLLLSKNLGAQTASIRVNNVDHRPKVSVNLELRDGRQFARSDVPIDELGRQAGLGALGIILDEDLSAGWLGAWQLPSNQPLETS